MRKWMLGCVVLLAVALVGCVTINVYFPEAAAQKAADKFIGKVLGNSAAPAPASSSAPPPDSPPTRPSAMLLDLLIPAAYAADTPDLRVNNATTEAIRGRMHARFQGALGQAFDRGTVGFTHNGLVALHDPAKVPLSERAQLNALVAQTNADSRALYREVAALNGHPEWASKIQATFAHGWIERAHSGWYYQNAAGQWQRK